MILMGSPTPKRLPVFCLFRILQFVSFLVWDSYYMSGQMEEWLLARCSENVYFAHALEFQLRASCLPVIAEGGVNVTVGGAGGTSNDELGNRITDCVMDSSADAVRNEAGVYDRDARGGGGGSDGGVVGMDIGSSRSGGGDVIDKVGKRAVELLLEDIAQKGELAAQRLVRDIAAAAAGMSPTIDGRESGRESLITSSTEPEMGKGGGKSLDSKKRGGTSERRGAGDDSTTAAAAAAPEKSGAKRVVLYRQTLDFLTRLAEIASSLTPLSKAERTPSLKKQLAGVGKDFLGAGTGGNGSGGSDEGRLLYVPLGDRHHRIVAVHPSDSFAFSTKERAPCFVCLEVIATRETRMHGGNGISGDGVGDGGGDRGSRGNNFGERMKAFRQWLPRSARFRRSFRFPGGREWMLSVGSGDDEANADGDGGGGDGSYGIDDVEEATRAGSRVREKSAESGAGGKGDDNATSRRSSSGRQQRGAGIDGVSREQQIRGAGSGEAGDSDDHYRLLLEDGAETAAVGSDRTRGAGVLMPLSDSREWWTEATAPGGGISWKGNHDHDNDKKDYVNHDDGASTPATASGGSGDSRKRPPFSSPPTTEERESGASYGATSAADANGVALQGRTATLTMAPPKPGEGEEEKRSREGVRRAGCDAGGAEEGRPCRPGYRLRAGEGDGETSAAAGMVGVVGPAEVAPQPQPQVLFNELWHDKSNRIRRCVSIDFAACFCRNVFAIECHETRDGCAVCFVVFHGGLCTGGDLLPRRLCNDTLCLVLPDMLLTSGGLTVFLHLPCFGNVRPLHAFYCSVF